MLDLGEVWGLEDSALVGFHDHIMGKLEKASLAAFTGCSERHP